ncbi:unnamed protein product [Peronospora belbahrii]|uniref:Uncharacterized protein n=1 Tax=Peronospora belbahrii TaxID=622444 RepID=A0AAU9KXH5_9STRA|nr:unnamed protein product [Peronospora belbahrii]CAH0517531.1 unnamed protein product [Peronospora belbahrii]
MEKKSKSTNVYVAELMRLKKGQESRVEKEETTQLAVQPKKKRIRRQKLELEYLRNLVGQLGEQLSTLEAKQTSVLSDKSKLSPEMNAPSIWKGIAERQLKDRARVEEQNRKLRSSLNGQIKLATKLEKILRKRPRDEEIAVLLDAKRVKPLMSKIMNPTDDEIFADQLAHVQCAHLVVDKIFGEQEFLDPSATFHHLQVINDFQPNTDVEFIKKASSMLPFNIQVTEKALWRALAEEGTKKDSYFLDRRSSTASIVAQSYGLNFRAGNFHTNVLGKETYRKYKEENCVVIMWKWVVDPIEVNGTDFHGVRCHETGWIRLREVNLDRFSSDNDHESSDIKSSTSTQLQSYTKMTMQFQDDIGNQELQVGALTDFVIYLHDTITEVCSKIVTDILVEEDWNHNSWVSTMQL